MDVGERDPGRCPAVTDSGVPCIKRIRDGASDHAGGHIFASVEVERTLDSGHYDARALLAGEPATWHEPQDCTSECVVWWQAHTVADLPRQRQP